MRLDGPPASPGASLLKFRPYQRAAFDNRTDGLQLWLWGRQTGKSFTLASWAVDRLITRPGRLVTVLSNSLANGMEFNLRCAEVCRLMRHAFEQEDLSHDHRFESMNCETRIRVGGQVGRVKILAANPRTARGFSGDLILDEFAFQEDSEAIWDAVEPILAANPDYLCRIASTPNGRHNLFYRLCSDPSLPVLKVTRSLAHAQGCPIFDPVTRAPIDPATARAKASNKRAYDQNYECVFEDSNMPLLTHGLISAAERPGVGVIGEFDWPPAALALLQATLPGAPSRKSARAWIDGAADPDAMRRSLIMNVCRGSADRYDHLIHSDIEIALEEIFDGSSPGHALDPDRQLFAGVDVGRHQDRTVITVVERAGNLFLVRAILRLDQMRLPDQQSRLEAILNIPSLRLVEIDATGLGVGLFEYTQQKFPGRVRGVNFATSVPASSLPQGSLELSPGGVPSVRLPEFLATQLLRVYEDFAIHHPVDSALRDDLRKPERIVGPSGRVSIAATRDAAGHADHFWSFALAINAALTPIPPPFAWCALHLRGHRRVTSL